jgi:hypothetical protein
LRKFGVQRVIKYNRPQKIMKTSTAAIFLATAFAMALMPSADATLTRGTVITPADNLAELERELGSSGSNGKKSKSEGPSRNRNLVSEERELGDSTGSYISKKSKSEGKKNRNLVTEERELGDSTGSYISKKSKSEGKKNRKF